MVSFRGRRVAYFFSPSRVTGRSSPLSGSPRFFGAGLFAAASCGGGGLAGAVAHVTLVDWVAGVDVAASGVCVVLASRRTWSLIIGGS